VRNQHGGELNLPLKLLQADRMMFIMPKSIASARGLEDEHTSVMCIGHDVATPKTQIAHPAAFWQAMGPWSCG
jgi:hypothetical protein